MEKLLLNINLSIDTYRGLKDKLVFDDIDVLSGLMKNISSDLFFLEEHRDNFSREYYTTIYNEMKEGVSATAAEKTAKHKHPEKRQLERFMASAYKVLEAIRSNVSFLKQEK